MANWDDGKHTSVRKIQLSYGSSGINSFKAEYQSAGNAFPAPKHGGNGDKTDEFIVEYPKEYLTAVTGYYTTTGSGDVVTALTFKSNTGKTYGPFGNKTKNYFSIEIPKDNQIVGFKGKSGTLLNDLNVHFAPVSTSGGGSDGLIGGGGGLDWDDKDEFSGVIKFEIGYDNTVIHSITLTYDQSGSIIPAQRRGGTGGTPVSLPFSSPDEYLISLSGTYGPLSPTSSEIVIKSLKPITNRRIYGPFGTETGTRFTLSSPNQQIIGFRGRSGGYLDAIGAYYGPIPTSQSGSGEESGKELVGKGPFGSAGGLDWNDGDEFSGVKKIEIGYDNSIVHSITVLYDDTGSDIPAQRRGGDGGTKIPIVFKYPEEYILSVSGTFTDVGITSLTIETNKQKYPTYGNASGTAFKLASAGEKIIGFRGTSGGYLNTLGAHFAPVTESSSGQAPVEGAGPYGSAGGLDWNDGDEYSGVKKIDVGYDDSVVHSITVVYDDTGSTIPAQRRGGDGGNKTPVELKFPDEYLVSVSGTYSDVAITSLTLETNKTTYGPFGKANGKAFKLTSSGSQIVGFRGTSGAYLNTLGAHFGPAPTPLPPARTSEKLEAHGGDGGNPFDDGENEGIKEILVGDSANGIQYLKFKYIKGGSPVEKEHGDENTSMPKQTVLINYPDEYLTYVEGTYSVIPGSSNPASIQSLTFKTNKSAQHGPYGFADGTAFSIDGKSGKIIGFHGQSSNVIYKLGVYLKPASS